MNDPLGKHWDQPARSEILLDDVSVLMNQEAFEKLADYSSSFPTGVYPGKMWKCRVEYYDESKGWFLVWFGYSEKGPGWCSNNFRKIIIS